MQVGTNVGARVQYTVVTIINLKYNEWSVALAKLSLFTDAIICW